MIYVTLGWCSLEGKEKVAKVSIRKSENLSENFSLSSAGTEIGRRGERTQLVDDSNLAPVEKMASQLEHLHEGQFNVHGHPGVHHSQGKEHQKDFLTL
jgi:hypothetical protein